MSNKPISINTEALSLDNNWESCIFDLFNPQYQLVGEEFFTTTIQKLNKYLLADYVFISRINKDDKTLDSIAFCNKKKILPPFSFAIANSLCEETILKNGPTYIQNIGDKNNINEFFSKKNITTYLGVPLFGSSRKPIGVLTALFTDSIENIKKSESLMFMFSSRIGAEIEHLESERELKRRNLELLVFKEELIRKNKELDQINGDIKKATLKAEESNKLKTSFLANLSHEIRTPMNAIIGFTELLKSNNLNADEKTEYLDIVYQNGNQLMRVMDALIDISKLQAESYVEPLEEISINKLFNESYTTYHNEIAIFKKPITLKLYMDAPNRLATIVTHKTAFLKVFDHLIDNAIKFTHEGEIEIGYYLFDDYFEFFVRDTGIGIPKGDEECIFDLFRQADSNSTRQFEGNGIGLSIVKKYIEIMKGTVWAESNQEAGALLKFRLPKSI